MSDKYSVIESLKLSSTYSSVADIERLIDKVCNTVGVNEDAYGNVLIAVTEAVIGSGLVTSLFVFTLISVRKVGNKA